MIDGTPAFDADILADALSELGQVAHEAGRVIDIALRRLVPDAGFELPAGTPMWTRSQPMTKAFST